MNKWFALYLERGYTMEILAIIAMALIFIVSEICETITNIVKTIKGKKD